MSGRETCPLCGGLAGLHHSILEGCKCVLAPNPMTYLDLLKFAQRLLGENVVLRQELERVRQKGDER